MTTNVIISNLPPEVTKEAITAYFAQHGAVVEVTLHAEGNPDEVTAVVAMDIDKATARLMAERSNSMYWHDRKLKVDVPLYI